MRDEYHIPKITKADASTLEALVEKLEGVDQQKCLATIAEYNQAVR